jgi:hypothetical protein
MRSLLVLAAVLPLVLPASAWAVDSYRWFHVTIDTPWAIFIFLLPMVVAPLVLMVLLYWRFAFRPKEDDKGSRGAEAPKK